MLYRVYLAVAPAKRHIRTLPITTVFSAKRLDPGRSTCSCEPTGSLSADLCPHTCVEFAGRLLTTGEAHGPAWASCIVVVVARASFSVLLRLERQSTGQVNFFYR